MRIIISLVVGLALLWGFKRLGRRIFKGRLKSGAADAVKWRDEWDRKN